MSEVTTIDVASRDAAYHGLRDHMGDRFINVRYASAPVGPLRFRPPVPHENTRIVDATRFGLAPPQPQRAAPAWAPQGSGFETGEDCLNLNLYTPAADDKRRPVIVHAFGGGFQGGDKRSLSPQDGKSYLDAGFAIAAINYRLTRTAPMPAAYLDCARALQFLRHQAKKWNLDPKRVASTGGSAGAGTSLWIAFHDDLADPKSDDPIARQSTRLRAVKTARA